LSWSPHYFYRHSDDEHYSLPLKDFLAREFKRNKESREKIVDLILKPYLNPLKVVLDYGCGPGFLANAVSPLVARVFAVDVSRGVLECARTLNCQENITYHHTTQLERIKDGCIDLIYSFAVIQHVTDKIFDSILDTSNRKLKDGGKIVFHVVVDQQGWRGESDWVSDKSIKGVLKLKFGLNCFNRNSESMVRMFEEHGFSSVRLQTIESICSENFDDICKQHLVTAVKIVCPNDTETSEKG
ncbi:class I SAM-dependent methyltransferase, partial [Kaarinaea lacus]